MNKHNNNALSICKYILDSMIYRQKILGEEENLKDKNKNEKKNLINVVKNKERFHLNSLITKNISLFTKNPNYKMLAWLIAQLTIFSLFVLSVNIFKKNLIPYFNA